MNENKTNINWYPGHMAKTKREIKENIALIDIVYEVIDARIPKSSKSKDVDELIKNKPRIFIFTRYSPWKMCLSDNCMIHNQNVLFVFEASDDSH